MQLVHLRMPRDLLRKLDEHATALSRARDGAPVTRTEVIRAACSMMLAQGDAARATGCTKTFNQEYKS